MSPDSNSPPSPRRRHLRVLVFGASLRRESLNQRLATLAARIIEAQGAQVEHASLSEFDSPSYDRDDEVESGVAPGALRFSERLLASDAFLIASPEFNASMPVSSRMSSTGPAGSGLSRSTAARASSCLLRHR
jgi:hypothetical protein